MKLRDRLLVALLAMATLPPAAAAEPSLGSALVHSIDGSGIRGRISFLDSGDAASGLVVAGSASGLDPSQGYVTLVYDRGALPGGPDACLPTGGLDGTRMFVGFWNVSGDGSGSLFVVKSGDSYAALEEIGAVSIRAADFSLQACGQAHAQP